MATRKTVFARVSTSAGTFLKDWFQIDFRGYEKTLNGGVGECVIGYGVEFDYDGQDLREGNDVEILLRDGDTLDDADALGGTRTIYKGYISLIERTINGSGEQVTVHILGYSTLLSLDILRDGDQTTLYSHDTTGLTTVVADLEPADIGHMARSIIDQFQAADGSNSGRVFYDLTDIPDTGTDATYTFIQKTYREALDALKSLAPENVYYYIDEIGRVTFKEIPSTPTHTFIFGRQISEMRVERSLEKVRNVALIWAPGIGYYHYEDAASIALYGRRAERINDYGIGDTGAFNAAGAKFLAENKEPSVKIITTIIDNNNDHDKGYDIEEIKPGDTCRLLGFSSTLSDIFRDNMLITRVRYNLDSVEIEVELNKSGLVDTQARQGRNIADIGNGGLGIPENYT